MLKIGASLKRKSISKAEAVLGHKPIREPSSNGRTKHMMEPAEELKKYNRKQLLANMSTEKSEGVSMFHDHNSVSLAQLFESRRQKLQYESEQKPSEQSSLKQQSKPSAGYTNEPSHGYSSLENQTEEKLERTEEEQAFQDYVLGEKVQKQQAKPTIKVEPMYVRDEVQIKEAYQPNTESERRMELQYIESQKKKIREFYQQREINQFIKEYQINKKKRQTQIMRKIAISKTVANLQYAIKHKQVACEEQNEAVVKKEHILLPQIVDRPRITQSLSVQVLKRPKKLRELQIQQAQIQSVIELQNKLSKKNVKIDKEKLKKALINIKTVPNQQLLYSNPQKNLPSNYYYQRFPLGY